MTVDVAQLTDTVVTTKRRLREELPDRAESSPRWRSTSGWRWRRSGLRLRRGARSSRSSTSRRSRPARSAPSRRQRSAKRGVVVVRDVFSREQAAAWDDELGEYLTVNGFGITTIDPELDQYFSTLESARPQIAGIYWSRPRCSPGSP